MDTLDYLRSILLPLIPEPHASTVEVRLSPVTQDTILVSACDEAMALILGAGGHTVTSLERLAQLHRRALGLPRWEHLAVRIDRRQPIGQPIGAPRRPSSVPELRAYVASVVEPISARVSWSSDERGRLTMPNVGLGGRYNACSERAVQRLARAWCGGRVPGLDVALR